MLRRPWRALRENSAREAVRIRQTAYPDDCRLLPAVADATIIPTTASRLVGTSPRHLPVVERVNDERTKHWLSPECDRLNRRAESDRIESGDRRRADRAGCRDRTRGSGREADDDRRGRLVRSRRAAGRNVPHQRDESRLYARSGQPERHGRREHNRQAATRGRLVLNFRTLEPTRAAKQSFDLGVDQFGGQNANIRATGSVDRGKLGYAFDYATQGTQGFDRGWIRSIFSISATARSSTACSHAPERRMRSAVFRK